tara:strand:- start:169 stop:651 length:483 start_codon:yes stop_codon:yes gene_type:complete
MASKHLSDRENWQLDTRVRSDYDENTFSQAIERHLPSNYAVDPKPKKLVVYSEGKGVKLDCKITNSTTGKSIFIENKTGNNGGNAHERAYKFLSKPLQKKIIKEHNTVSSPFFWVFSGETFQGQKYIDEFDLLLGEEHYAIMDLDYGNIEEVAKQIRSIL